MLNSELTGRAIEGLTQEIDDLRELQGNAGYARLLRELQERQEQAITNLIEAPAADVPNVAQHQGIILCLQSLTARDGTDTVSFLLNALHEEREELRASQASRAEESARTRIDL